MTTRTNPAFDEVIEVQLDAPGWKDAGIRPEDAKMAAVNALQTVRRAPCQSGMTILLTDDARVRELNQNFRDRDRATNVLSFPSGDDDYIGDIAVAFETVQREAAEQAVRFDHHMSHLVVHGVLHLLGYDHHGAAEAEEMEALEIGILSDMGIDNPYAGDRQ